jgi:hypothetical protein
MTGGLERPVSSLGWDLRTAMALGREIRVVLSGRCDGVRVAEDGSRVLQGRVQRVSPTNAHMTIQGVMVPLDEVLAVHRPHYSQSAPSDPTDPLAAEIEAVQERLRSGA